MNDLKKIIYIGNHLKGSNPTTLNLLTASLVAEGFTIAIYSNKKNKFLRLLHMCWGVIWNRKADFVLIDTYSTSNFYYALVVSQLARCFSIPYIPILHGGNLPKRIQNNPKLSNLIFKNAFINIAPSNYLFSAFQKNSYQVKFIPNAIELKHYTFKERTSIQPKLLWVRAFQNIYNPQMAVEVLSLLKKYYPTAKLCMVGPDKDRSFAKVKKLAQEKGLLNAIEFTGLLTKEAWIAKSKELDIFINTTTIDNTPVSVVEAMALGLPVVSTNVGGLPYLIEDQINGLLVENGAAKEMAHAIIELIENPAKAQQIINNARSLVEKFELEVVIAQWKKLLK
jgi:glycosyltransferase involved in cell wall biosynthesis